MSESEQPKDARGPKPGELPHAPGERELDDALAKAADLAAGLAKEVREADPPTPRTSAKDERLALDQELAELERLANKAADDLGAEPTKRKKKRPSTPLPDFMSELTGPAPEVAPRGRGAANASKSPDAADTVVGEVVADGGDFSEAGAGKHVQSPGSALAESVEDHAASVETEPVAPIGRVPGSSAPVAPPPAAHAFDTPLTHGNNTLGVVGNIAKPRGKGEPPPNAQEAEAAPTPAVGPSALTRMLYPTAKRLVAILEILDRPFAWVGQPVRQVIGWFAVATLLTSLIVGVVAMFR